MAESGSRASVFAIVHGLRRGRLPGAALSAAVAIASAFGCGSGAGTPSTPGTGGLPGTGGATQPASTGGTTSPGSGGTTASGGAPGTGGRSSAGGTVGSGGTTGSGGASGRGGATGLGGVAGAGGAAGGALGRGGAADGGASGRGGVTGGGGAAGGATSTGGTAGRGGAGGASGKGGSSGAGGSTVACPSSSACIDFTNLQQEIDGFGAASVGHGALTTTELDAAFKNDTTSQLGLSIVRVEVRVEGQSSWAAEKANAAGAKARGAKYAMASPWTPPASMKSNNNTVGGSLSTSAYADYAAYLKSYADYMGSDVDIISIQNEPNITVTYVSCSWNATQMFNFVKNNARDIGRSVLMPETFNYDKSYSDQVLNDATAASHITHIGLHLYGAGASAYTLAIQKQKRVWMTEHMFDPEDIGTMMTMAKEIMDCMNSQMNGYVWWYLRVPNCNLITSSGGITNKGAIMGQFSKFVRPGSNRATAPYQPQTNVSVQAYAGTRNVVIALNRNTSAKTQDFTVTNGTFANVHRYTTSSSKKLVDDGPVTVTNGSFTASLDAQSVTTFVADGTP
jgi:glucuronoarabinoxylan endo-1,4-beta-xylanase